MSFKIKKTYKIYSKIRKPKPSGLFYRVFIKAGLYPKTNLIKNKEIKLLKHCKRLKK